MRRSSRSQANIYYHIFGPHPDAHEHFDAALGSPTAKDLARAYLAGEECDFALNDALAECGLPDVGAHFIRPNFEGNMLDHRRGCWVADRILGLTE